jgi:hypothetical protein
MVSSHKIVSTHYIEFNTRFSYELYNETAQKCEISPLDGTEPFHISVSTLYVVKVAVFSDVTSCTLVDRYSRVLGTYCLHIQGTRM